MGNSLPALEGFLNYLEYQIVENSEFKNLVREFYITFLGVDLQEELKSAGTKRKSKSTTCSELEDEYYADIYEEFKQSVDYYGLHEKYVENEKTEGREKSHSKRRKKRAIVPSNKWSPKSGTKKENKYTNFIKNLKTYTKSPKITELLNIFQKLLLEIENINYDENIIKAETMPLIVDFFDECDISMVGFLKFLGFYGIEVVGLEGDRDNDSDSDFDELIVDDDLDDSSDDEHQSVMNETSTQGQVGVEEKNVDQILQTEKPKISDAAIKTQQNANIELDRQISDQNINKTQTEETKIDQGNTSTRSDLTFYYMLGMVAVIFITLGIFVYRRRRKAQKYSGGRDTRTIREL